MAGADGKAKALVYTGLQDVAGDRIPSPTGFGSIPAEHPDVRFLLARGYRFEQVERLSRLPLPVPGIDERLAAALAASGPDYALHTYVGPTPERWREDMAVLATRMSTDAPSAGLEEPEDVWTVERIIEADERAAASPRDRVVAVVEHVPSGHLAGFTVLSVPTAAAPVGGAVRDPRAPGAPRSQARHAAQGREPGALAAGEAGASIGHDVQRGGEPLHARCQRIGRLRADRPGECLAEGSVNERPSPPSTTVSPSPRRRFRSGSATTSCRARSARWSTCATRSRPTPTARATSRTRPKSCTRTGATPHQPKRLLLRAGRRARRRSGVARGPDRCIDGCRVAADRDPARVPRARHRHARRSSGSSAFADRGWPERAAGLGPREGAARRAADVADRLRLDPAGRRLRALRCSSTGSRSSRSSAAAGCCCPWMSRTHLAAARRPRGPDYRVHTWVGDVPEQWREDYRGARSRG